MSIQHISKVLDARDERLTGCRKLVLVTLANRTDAQGRCWPSQELVAGECGITTRALRDHFQALEKDGFLRRYTKHLGQGNGSRTTYVLILDSLIAPEEIAPEKSSGATVAPEENDTCTGSRPPITNRQEPSLIDTNVSIRRDTQTSKPSKPKAQGDARGSRLPPDWSLPDDWLADATECAPKAKEPRTTKPSPKRRSEMKPISSAISGTARRAQQAASSTGAQHGATGFDLTLSADPSREMHQVVMARLPTSNTAAALSRMQQFGVQCSVKMETVFPTSEDGDTTFRQRPTSLTLDIGSSADLEAALRVANESLAPASVQQIEEWLAELSVKTARRKASEMGAELALSVYTGALRGYPADAVRHVLSSYRGQWFPTWGELADRLDELTERLIAFVMRAVAPPKA